MAEEKKETVEVAEKDITVLDENDVVHLSKPLPNGQDFLAFDWDKINGYALIRCKANARKQDQDVAVMPSLSPAYQAAVAAVATGAKYDDILALRAPDFMAVTLRVQNFLLSSPT